MARWFLVLWLVIVSGLVGGSGYRVQAAGNGEPRALAVYLVPSRDLSVKSTPDQQIREVAGALQDWVNEDVARVWALPTVRVVAVPRGTQIKRGQWAMRLMPFTDDWTAIGYHTVNSQGQPYAEVGVEAAREQDGNWTICASHELVEMLVNPYANRYAMDSQGKTVYILETADPVASVSYWWGDRGRSYRMADYVYPNYFVDGARYPFDRLHRLRAPFQFLPDGGYQSEVGVMPTSIAPYRR